MTQQKSKAVFLMFSLLFLLGMLLVQAQQNHDNHKGGKCVQHIMNQLFYQSHPEFSHGQKDRMRAALYSSVSERNNLWSLDNLIAVGLANPSVAMN